MLSSNISLRTAYKALLSTIQYDGNPVQVFFQQLPTTISPGIYIIFGSIRNNNLSNKTSSATQTSVQVSIFTNSLKYSDGAAVDTVANEVLNRLWPYPAFNITLDHNFFQVVTTELQSDFTQDNSQLGAFVYIDRIMTFTHGIYQNVS